MIAACHRLGRTLHTSGRGENGCTNPYSRRKIRRSEVLRGLLVLDFGIPFGGLRSCSRWLQIDPRTGSRGIRNLASGIAHGASFPEILCGPTACGQNTATFCFRIRDSYHRLVSPRAWVAFLGLGLLGAADTVNTVRNTWLQLSIELSSKITALSSLVTKSGPRLGQVEAGLFAAAIGPQFDILEVSLVWTAWVFEVIQITRFHDGKKQ